MDNSLFFQGFQIMVIGIAGVFAFLILMVISMNISGGILGKLKKFFPEPEVSEPSAGIARGSELEIAVVIAAAKAKADQA